MLVNLTEKPKSMSRAERHIRHVLKNRWRNMPKDFIQFLKATKGFKAFQPYTPSGDEFTEDLTSNFTGCFICRRWNADLDNIAAYTKQTPSMHGPAKLNYDPDREKFEYWDCFGLCDNATQVIRFYYQRKAEGRYPGNHVILLTPMYNDFRWHKWGRYIGDFTPSHEHFADESGIEMVYSYKIVRIK